MKNSSQIFLVKFFLISSLLLGAFSIIYQASQVYRRMLVANEESEKITNGLAYFRTKIKMAPSLDVQELADTTVLVLIQDNYYDCIYYYQDYVYEIYITDLKQFSLLAGEKIFPISSFNISSTKQYLEIQLTINTNENTKLVVNR